MATAPLKSKPLHNFSLPFLKWGGTGAAKNHHSAVGTTTSTSNHRLHRPDQVSDSDDRHHRAGSRPARASRFAFSSSPTRLHSNNDDNDEVPAAAATVVAVEAAEEAVQKPWKLRPRKPAVPVSGGASRNGNMETHEAGVQVHGDAKSTRCRGTMMAEAQCSTEKKRKFWIALSKEEIEEDIFVMTGSRPNRRPRKRPRNVQKQMDTVFPGLWLVGYTADTLNVPDTPAKR